MFSNTSATEVQCGLLGTTITSSSLLRNDLIYFYANCNTIEL